MSKLIPPTPGRVVWYWPSQQEIDAKSITVIDQGQPLAATVAHVWHDRMVNLSVVDQAGVQFRRTSVQLLQDGDERPRTSEGPFAEWMPYQLGQAAKAATETPQTDAALPVETKVYTDGTSATGTSATGTPPLPDQSPAEQEAAAPTPAPAPAPARKKAKA